jgi:hypothetical protein
MHASPSAGQNVTPRCRAADKTRNSGSEAKTSQNILRDNDATASVLPVSLYSQTNAGSDVVGNDASTAAKNELRFPISETAMTRAMVTTILAAYCNMLIGHVGLEVSGHYRDDCRVIVPCRNGPFYSSSQVRSRLHLPLDRHRTRVSRAYFSAAKSLRRASRSSSRTTNAAWASANAS